MSDFDDRKYTRDIKHGGSCDQCGNRIQIIQAVKSNILNVWETLPIECPNCNVTVTLFLRSAHIEAN